MWGFKGNQPGMVKRPEASISRETAATPRPAGAKGGTEH